MGNPNEILYAPVAPEAAKYARRRRGLVWIALALCAYVVWNMDDVVNVDDASHDLCATAAEEFDWATLIPSETLEWTRCYEEPFVCARLEVPLDYSQPHGQKAAIALIKYPSKYPVGDDKWRGPILYNPGGPGGSGVQMVRGRAANFSKIIGDDFDHIGFDPRGLGFTTPGLSVFPTESERKTFALSEPGIINSTTDALARLYGQSKLLGELAAERPAAAHVAKYMSTAFVARDMLSITKAHGRDKLLYWGFSYGTVLGITYASMFPDNVDRLIVDGVADTENYYSGAWDNNLRDADAGLDLALKACSKSASCPLYESTSSGVHNRIEAIFTKLKHEPVVVRNKTSGNYGIVDYSTARAQLFAALYKPVALFPKLFDAYAKLEQGDALPLFELSGDTNALWRCSTCGNGEGKKPVGGAETTIAIACSDADVVEHDGLKDLTEFYKRMARMSPFADIWSVHIGCAGWKIRSRERFNGPFVGNTSFPVLFIGNTADPVTPLWAAKKMSKGFKDAVVLTQNSPGHCSLSHTSLCTAKAIRAYFREGVVPKAGTVCEVEEQIFVPDDVAEVKNIHDVATMSAEDRELLEAVRDASAGFDVPKFGLRA